MDKITQTERYRQSLILYALKYGVTKAAVKYHTNRQYVYRWMKRYDGTLASVMDRSRRPYHHANEHTQEELLLIKNMLRRNKHTGLVVFWVKLRLRGYTRSISCLYRVMRSMGVKRVTLPNPKKKYLPKAYEQMKYPEQRIQVDVKFVPASCLTGEAVNKKFFQDTAIDEYSRFGYLGAFEEHSTYSSAVFLEHMLKFFKFKLECVQTDNGTEFTNRFTMERDKPTLFEKHLCAHGIKYKLIKPYTPRHNGKVERS
ncbi:MAG: DDE-type integrase/transposase/recombinase, partial [Cloacibacillus sp.]